MAWKTSNQAFQHLVNLTLILDNFSANVEQKVKVKISFILKEFFDNMGPPKWHN